MIWAALVGTLFATVASGAALGAGLGLTGLVILQFFAGGSTELSVQAVWNALNSFTLSAVPMFILLGEVLVESGIGNRIYGAVAPLFHRIPGKLLHTNIAVCTLFGAVSGSSAATAAAVGSAAYPELSRRGYDKALVLGSLAGGGTLGLLIPPSLSLIIYGAWQDVSVGRLFLAGIVPGLMMAALFMGYIFVSGMLSSRGVPETAEAPTLAQILRSLVEIWPLLILIGAVLGTIYAGLATPTEAAGLGVLAAIVLGYFFGTLTPARLWTGAMRAVASFGALSMVLIGAIVLAQSISIIGLPRQMMESVAAFQLSKYEVLTVVVGIYVLLGCFFEGLSLMLMTLPFVYPLLVGLGFDPVWLGVFVTIMIEIGMITPPVGVNLFVLAAITRQEVPIAAIARAATPYWIMLLLGTAIMTAFPEIALFLPNLLM